MDEKEKKKEQELNEMINLGMLNAAVNPMSMMSPVVPLILNNGENKEEKEKKLRE